MFIYIKPLKDHIIIDRLMYKYYFKEMLDL
jgi:hypothetical protein